MGRKEIPELIPSGTRAIIIQNDSILITGDKLLQTFDCLEVAEFSAESLVMAKPIGDLLPINDEQVKELRKVFLKK
jgi:L-fuculose-phosphate aldolase